MFLGAFDILVSRKHAQEGCRANDPNERKEGYPQLHSTRTSRGSLRWELCSLRRANGRPCSAKQNT
jgi:hypothetical protein